MKKFTFRISKPHFNRLMSHLFPGDGDEHGAVIAAGICESEQGIRLLTREVFLAEDGIDYVPGKYGYRALTSNFVARISDFCARERLCYFAVHCHGGSDFVDFSTTDLNSHARGYPSANILAATREDFEKDKRRELMSRIATGNWDAIIVTHSGFEKIPMSEETKREFFQTQLDELESAIKERKEDSGSRRTVKQLETKL